MKSNCSSAVEPELPNPLQAIQISSIQATTQPFRDVQLRADTKKGNKKMFFVVVDNQLIFISILRFEQTPKN